MLDLAELVKNAHRLEPLPQSVTRLLELLVREDVTMEEIEKVFAADGPLTARLLRRANSASSGSRKQIGTISAALVRLGLGSVMALAVSESAHKQLAKAVPAYGLEEGELWRHAQAARLAAEHMRRYCKAAIPRDAPTAALLHDIGKIVLAHALGPGELAILRQASSDGSIDTTTEKEVLEVHHGELGGLIAQHWKLPETIVRGIIYHHNPQECTEADNAICHIVCFADWAAKAAVHKMAGQDHPELPTASVKTLGVDLEHIDALLDEVIAGLGNLDL